MITTYGAIDLIVMDQTSRAKSGGTQIKPAPCRQRIWVAADGIKLAHELAHALGLEHVDDEANVMDALGVGDLVTDAQLDEVQDEAGAFRACVGGAEDTILALISGPHWFTTHPPSDER